MTMIAKDGMEAGQRIDLEKLRAAIGVAATIDAAGIAASQPVPCPQRDRRGLPAAASSTIRYRAFTCFLFA